MNFRRRLENLERRFTWDDFLTLIMPDGAERILPLRGRNGVLDLFDRCLCDPHCPEAELIRLSVSQIDSSGGHMGELISSMLNSPVEPNQGEPGET